MVVLDLHCCPLAVSSSGQPGLLSSCGGRASHYSGFSYCGARALGHMGISSLGACVPTACEIFPNQGSNQ